MFNLHFYYILVLINKYIISQGIVSHIACTQYFEDVICSLSLESRYIMDLTHDNIKKDTYLKSKSIL